MDGSEIAKSGFTQESLFVEKFNSDEDFRKKIEFITKSGPNSFAIQVSGKKHDVQIATKNSAVNIQVKKFTKSGFNQVDKRWVFEWESWLKSSSLDELSKFTGAQYYPEKKRNYPRDLSEHLIHDIQEQQEEIVKQNLFRNGKVDFFFCFNEHHELFIAKANHVLDFILSEKPRIEEKRTTIPIGRFLTLQRKGGDGGAFSATMIQCKLRTGSMCKELLSQGLAEKIEFKV